MLYLESGCGIPDVHCQDMNPKVKSAEVRIQCINIWYSNNPTSTPRDMDSE